MPSPSRPAKLSLRSVHFGVDDLCCQQRLYDPQDIVGAGANCAVIAVATSAGAKVYELAVGQCVRHLGGELWRHLQATEVEVGSTRFHERARL